MARQPPAILHQLADSKPFQLLSIYDSWTYFLNGHFLAWSLRLVFRDGSHTAQTHSGHGPHGLARRALPNDTLSSGQNHPARS